MAQTATASLMRSINRSAILDLIRRSGPIARSQIALQLKTSLPTVMRIVDELAAEDLVRDHGSAESTGGRPRSLIEFNGDAYAVIGVDLGGTRVLGTVADLAGNIQHEVSIAHRCFEGKDGDGLERLCALIEQLLAAPRPDGQRIRGIGIGAPGITLHPQGVVAFAPSLGWRNLPLKDILSRRYHLPVFVENDVNLAALGELGFGAGRGARDLVCISAGTGIGAGIILGGTLYRGHDQAAGEIGYLLPEAALLGQRYDSFGALESLASSRGIAERGRRALQEAGLPEHMEGLTAEDVFAAARRDETWAQQVVDTTVDYLSLAVASVSVLLNPEVVILGGGMARLGGVLAERIACRLDGAVPFLPRLVVSQLGLRAAVMGASVLVLTATMEHFVVSRLP